MLSPGCTPLLRSDPRSVGRYKILGRLGAGGMATVYLADDDGFVALKLVHEDLAADAEFRARFERETELAARVPAHCTAALRDTGVHEDRPYLVTDYLPGTPLHRLVDSEGPLDPASLHNIAVGLAAGLTAIHGCDLVHRDIKPSNVMVTRGGVRIIDFGIARTLGTRTEFTRPGIVMGSLGWTSPEQLGARSPIPAMDVFAWGCVVAYAATGRHPFGGDDSVSRSWQILNGEPDLTGVPDTVVDLVRAALDRNLDRRPTAQELLLGLVGGATPAVKVRAKVASVGASRGRIPRRRWALLLGAVPVGLAVVLSLSSAAGGGLEPVRPSGTNPPVSVESPTPGATRGPTAKGDRGGQGGQSSQGGGQSESGDPTSGADEDDDVSASDGPTKKPKKSKKP